MRSPVLPDYHPPPHSDYSLYISFNGWVSPILWILLQPFQTTIAATIDGISPMTSNASCIRWCSVCMICWYMVNIYCDILSEKVNNTSLCSYTLLNPFHLCRFLMFSCVFLKISMTHNQTKTCFVTGDCENRKTAVRLQRLGPLLLGSAHPWSRLLFLVFCPRQERPCFRVHHHQIRARSLVFALAPRSL